MSQNVNAEFLCPHPTALYGDDFTLQEIEKWYGEEENGYADLGI